MMQTIVHMQGRTELQEGRPTEFAICGHASLKGTVTVGTRDDWYKVSIQGDRLFKRFLRRDVPLTIGRRTDPRSNVVDIKEIFPDLPDSIYELVSRVHLKIFQSPNGKFFLKDLGRAGTEVDDKYLLGRVVIPKTHLDLNNRIEIIPLGRSLLTVTLIKYGSDAYTMMYNKRSYRLNAGEPFKIGTSPDCNLVFSQRNVHEFARYSRYLSGHHSSVEVGAGLVINDHSLNSTRLRVPGRLPNVPEQSLVRE